MPQNFFWNSKDYKTALIFSVASMIVEFLAIMQFLLNKSCENISEAHAATCLQKLAAAFSAMTFSITTLGITTFNTKGLFVTLSKNDTKHKNTP